jgi:hypothetical protein
MRRLLTYLRRIAAGGAGHRRRSWPTRCCSWRRPS